MEKFSVTGGMPMRGGYRLSGAKNVALKTCFCSLLTESPVIIRNIPLIRDVFLMKDLLEHTGVTVQIENHTAVLDSSGINNTRIPLELGARLRTSSLLLGPMLARFGDAVIPNPGGCRIGARPINRLIDGLKQMGAEINYDSNDGYFHAKAKRLHGADITFTKNTHTGTETIILAAVLADGVTVIRNAATEIEVDDLINMLVSMGADINRISPREIRISGVKQLHGTEYEIISDRNEEVTIAIAAAVTGGKITVERSIRNGLSSFLNYFRKAGGTIREIDANTTEYSGNGNFNPTDITTAPHPGFMTDWQAPWAVFMTRAQGISSIHETVFESRFSYVNELIKMGAKVEFFQPKVKNPEMFYNFNWSDKMDDIKQAIRITGTKSLHNAVLEMHDLRAGASLLLAALIAEGESFIYGIEQIDRGYENIEGKLHALGARIRRTPEEVA
jgi:UDP-N-acetylglucosamine 1-carboxyvinyltransferase